MLMNFHKINLLFAVLLLSAVLPAADFQVIGRGVGNGAIVLPERANQIEQKAAQELQYHLRQSTGAELPVISEKRLGPEIKGGYFLGNTKAAKLAGLDVSGEVPDTFIIHYRDNFLYIVGKDDKSGETHYLTAVGTLDGVYHYCHHALGARYLWPGKTGEYIPKRKDLALNDDLSGKYPPSFTFVLPQRLREADEFRWGRRVMRTSCAGMMVHAGRGGHAFGDWAERYGKQHPDWFALRSDGVRDVRAHAAMCVSNSGFQDEIIRLWYGFQEKSPEKKFAVNLKENDTVNRCVCDHCRALDGEDHRGPTGRYDMYRNVSERYAAFYRQVWEKAAALDPRATVSFYAYQSYFYAPEKTKLNANFLVGLVPDIPFPRRPEHNEWLRREYQGWRDSGATFYLRPNYFLGGYCMPEVWYDQYDEEFKFLHELGNSGVMIDGPSGMWGTRCLDFYVMGRLCVNPEAEVSALVAEFLSGFGEAAPEIAAYFEYWRRYLRENTDRINTIYEKSARRWYFHGFHYAAYAHKIFPSAELIKARVFLDRASALVNDNPEFSERVKFLRQGLEHAVLTSQCAGVFDDPSASPAQRREAWDNLLAYRKGLMPYVVEEKLLNLIENNVWKINDANKPAGDSQALPEFWQVLPDPKEMGEKNGYYRPDFNDAKWAKASSWKTLESQGFNQYINMWYRVKAYVPEHGFSKVILHLGAVDESCDVWVNGSKIGSFRYDAKKDAKSWEKPREFDISSAVKYGADNVICVKLINQLGNGGIWKPSYLVYRGKD